MTPPDTKAQLRHEISRRIERLTEDQRESASRLLCQRLDQATAAFDGIIMAFLPIPDEIDLLPFLRSRIDRGIAVPIVDWNARTMQAGRLHGLAKSDLQADRHGLQVPVQHAIVPKDEIGLVLVPGVAFDRSGHRLGRGGGFYDRFLSGRSPATIGVGFDEQLVDAVPMDNWDRSVDRVLTPSNDFDGT
ncbi:MAG: 5-formyltetrahydrofolate cyclo-ligase [Phycisphaerales bacterium]|nr:5-formyltetrahydrofolate cyclo-ligase [Phycisphaerales bacterium]